MSEVSRVQGALEDALADVEPAGFRERIDERLADIRYTPAVCTMRAARAVDGTVAAEAAAERAAGVQLSYEGLVLTRSLIGEEPWMGDGDVEAADVELLVAEVMVSKGVAALAHSGVVDDAVAVVRRFGRDQTRLQRTEEAAVESSLEYDTLELAVVAGADLAGGTVSPAVYEFAADLASRLEACPLPPVESLDGVGEDLARVVQAAEGVEESPSRLDI